MSYMSKFKILLASAVAGVASASLAASAGATVYYPLTPMEPGTISGTETVPDAGSYAFTFTVDSPFTFSFIEVSGVFEFPTYPAGSPAGSYTVPFTATGPGVVGYSLTTSGVPEPAAWAMMLVGVGGVGVALRRRSAKASLAAA